MALRRRTWFRLAGLAYFALGSLFLWWFLTLLLPLAEARAAFERLKADHDRLAPIRDPLRPLLKPNDKGEINAQAQALLDSLAKAGVPSELLKQLVVTDTEFERFEKRARSDFESRQSLPTPQNPATPPPPPEQKGDGDSGKVTPPPGPPPAGALTPKRMPPSDVFRAYLESEHESLYSSSLVREWAALESWNLTLRAFICLSLAMGLLGGCIRLFGFGRRGASASGTHDLLWPLATPVLAVFVVMLLTGFGRIFKTEIDPATSKFLIVLVGAIALSPEVFLIAIRRYIYDLLMEFRPQDHQEPKKVRRVGEDGDGPESELDEPNPAAISEAIGGASPRPVDQSRSDNRP